jgi:formate transporter
MTELYGADAYAPVEVARRVEQVGVAKARMAAWPYRVIYRRGGATKPGM